MQEQVAISSIWCQVRDAETCVSQLEKHMLGLLPDITGGVSKEPRDRYVPNGICLCSNIHNHVDLGLAGGLPQILCQESDVYIFTLWCIVLDVIVSIRTSQKFCCRVTEISTTPFESAVPAMVCAVKQEDIDAELAPSS